MSEVCPRCGKVFANTKALGSHLHYRHEYNKENPITKRIDRTESGRKQFRSILEKCLLDVGLKLPPDVDKIEIALIEIPRGVSPQLDQYRDAFNLAWRKEKLLIEVEELLLHEATE